MEPLSDAQIWQQINSVSWYHAFDVLPGFMTPGLYPCKAAEQLNGFGVPADLTGFRVLEIAAWDGPFAFELERRGATVVALDIQDPSHTGFNVAKALRNSQVTYVQDSVYNLTQHFDQPFDLICFFGVFYHLKHPILAFEEIQSVLAPEGTLLIHGECLRNYAETLDGRGIVSHPHTPGWWDRKLQGLGRRLPWAKSGLDRLQRLGQASRSAGELDLIAIANSDVPFTLCYPGKYKDDSNWFIPNLACIRSWLLAAGLELQSYSVMEDSTITAPDGKPYPTQGMAGRVKKRPVEGLMEEFPVYHANWRDREVLRPYAS